MAALLARHLPHLQGVSTVTILLLAVANFNSFIIPWIMTGGGPSNASHIWITHIYELAFGRQRWGVASAYSVLLFLILDVARLFLRARPQRRREERSAANERIAPLTAPRVAQADRRLALGRTHLPRAHAAIHRRADDLDAAHVDQVRLCGHAISAAMVAGRTNAWRAIRSCSIRQNSVGQDFLRFFWNSLFVSTATTILSVIVAVPAAYAFSRFTFQGRKFLFFAVLLRNMFPAVIFLVPLFILMRLLGLVNTHGSLVLTYLTFGLPLAIWLLKGFYDNIPVPARAGGPHRRRDAVPGLSS
jgi:ABC-type glycerol-3-phosphate transport system permease component